MSIRLAFLAALVVYNPIQEFSSRFSTCHQKKFPPLLELDGSLIANNSTQLRIYQKNRLVICTKEN